MKKEKRSLEGRRELLKLALSMNKASNRNLETIKSLYNKSKIVKKLYTFIKIKDN